MDTESTVTTSLGLTEDWYKTHQTRTREIYENNKYMSDCIIELASDIKQESFGDDVSRSLSDYEKKLVIAGMELASLKYETAPLSAEAILSYLVNLNTDLKE